jgi:PhnB protein
MQLNPYLGFDGRCEEAFRFYERVLGGKIAFMMRWSEGPMAEQSDPAMRNQIMHARLVIGDQMLMGSDGGGQCHQPMAGFSVTISVDDPAEADRIYNALSEGGEVRMPIQETFWARRFGMLTDRFGTPWMINCEKPMQAA